MREAPTIGKWLGADGLGSYNEVQVARLWHDVTLVFAGKYRHVFRVFVKDEPHKIAKVLSKRWRLIIASSLPVQMVWRMCFYEQNHVLNQKPYECPSKHGLTFCYGGWRRFLAHVKTQALNYSRDISAWDVNAPGWVFDVIGRWRQSWPGVTDEWIRVQEMLYADAYEHSELLFSNGLVVKQGYKGFMKSGLYNTISDNSLAMVAMHVLASIRSGQHIGNIAVTGDDVMQSIISDTYVDRLQELGCRVKEVLNHIEFMGTDYTKGHPEPMYFQKHLMGYVTKPEVQDEVLDAYCRLYAYSDRFRFWKTLADQTGIKTRSSAYYLFWYSSPMARILRCFY